MTIFFYKNIYDFIAFRKNRNPNIIYSIKIES